MTNKFNFNSNLLKASISQNIEDAKKEWFIICKHKRADQECQCICGHLVKCVVYMYNIHNNKNIIVGSVCCKKFNMSKKQLPNKILKNILNKIFIKGKYKSIDDIDKYCNEIQEELSTYFKNKIKTQDIDILDEVKKEIDDLIKNYNINYLSEILEEVNNKIQEYNQRLEYMKIQYEKEHQEYLNRQKLYNIEYEKQQAINQKNKELKRIENEKKKELIKIKFNKYLQEYLIKQENEKLYNVNHDELKIQQTEILYNKCNNCDDKLTDEIIIKHKQRYNSLCNKYKLVT